MQNACEIRFDGWALRMDAGELFKDGCRIRLQDQPLQVLHELVSHAGALVTREQLIARLWPKGVVDFDTGLNSAMRKLRRALQDEAETPRYIETMPRKGYRFIGKLETPCAPAAAVTAGATADGGAAAGAEVAVVGSGTQTDPAGIATRALPGIWYKRPASYMAASAVALITAAVLFVNLTYRPTVAAQGDSIGAASRPGRTAPREPSNADASKLYSRGQQLMTNLRVADADEAVELFRRVTTLEPLFARGYLALGQAYVLTDALRTTDSSETREQAERAIDRALELEPALGEGWIERARLQTDPVEAEALYRKGLALSPGYAVGYARYAEFLWGRDRMGEALAMIDHARQLEPTSPRLHLRAAQWLVASRDDTAGAERILREALQNNPRFQPALMELGEVKVRVGEFAEGIRLLEQAIRLDPESSVTRHTAALAYLDVGDPDAALATVRTSQAATYTLMSIAQYERKGVQAAHFAQEMREQWVWSEKAVATAMRDEAMRTGNFAPALQLIETRYALARRDAFRIWDPGLDLVYAHTLMLGGDAGRGRKIVAATLMRLESESVGRAEHGLSRLRATAYALLGDDEHALEELSASLKRNSFQGWWYTAELDPVFARLRHDDRFQALAAQVRQHRLEQRVLVEQMRRTEAIPPRVPGGGSQVPVRAANAR